MPAPKNLERPESPSNNVPPPSERMERNNDAATNLAKTKKPSFQEELDREGTEALLARDARVLRLDRAAQDVFEEGNRGEEAWHDAMRSRRNETRAQTSQRVQGRRVDEVEQLRRGELNGKPRQNSLNELRGAHEIRRNAEKIRHPGDVVARRMDAMSGAPTRDVHQDGTITSTGTRFLGRERIIHKPEKKVPATPPAAPAPKNESPAPAPKKDKKKDRLADTGDEIDV